MGTFSVLSPTLEIYIYTYCDVWKWVYMRFDEFYMHVDLFDMRADVFYVRVDARLVLIGSCYDYLYLFYVYGSQLCLLNAN